MNLPLVELSLRLVTSLFIELVLCSLWILFDFVTAISWAGNVLTKSRNYARKQLYSGVLLVFMVSPVLNKVFHNSPLTRTVMWHTSPKSVTGIQLLEIGFQPKESFGIIKRKGNSFPDYLNSNFWGNLSTIHIPKWFCSLTYGSNCPSCNRFAVKLMYKWLPPIFLKSWAW